MANVKVRSGVVRNAVGAVLAGKPAQLRNATSGVAIGAPVNTDPNGRYTFAGLDETIRYQVEVAFGGGSSQLHVNSPISPDIDDLYVNTSMRTAPGATVAFGGAVSASTITATNAPLVSRSSSNARVMLIDTDAATNEKVWGINNQDGDIGIQPWNDSELGASGDGLFLIRGTGAALGNAGLTVGGVQRIFANTNGVVLTGANTSVGTLVVGAAGASVGELTIRGMGSSEADIALIEGDTNNGWNLRATISDDSFRISRYVSGGTDWLSISPAGLVTVPGTLAVTGATTLGGNLTVNGLAANFAGNVTLGGILNAAQSVVALDGFFHNGVLGFYGAGGNPKPTVTGSRGGNAALADLLNELATLGLITNGTT